MPRTFPAGDPTAVLHRAHGVAPLSGRVRSSPDDFVVIEELGYQASGDGEHDFLTVRKRERNTHDVARALASLAGVPQVAVGYAGLKDRQAVTTQHFTVQLPGRASPDWSALDDASLRIESVARHHRKIRRGALRGNRFEIVVRDVAGDRDAAEARLAAVSRYGVPNYFGPQRFGHAGGNLAKVDALFDGRARRPRRELRSIWLSAARAQLFNLVLDARVAASCWCSLIDGDVLMLAGSQRQFLHEPDDPTIAERVAQADVHVSGPLVGRDSRALKPRGAAAALEASVLADWQDWLDGLSRQGLDADRRALRLVVSDLQWRWRDDALWLAFGLPAGSYATAVLRELLADPDAPQV